MSSLGDRILATIERDKFADIARRHAGDEWAKYLDLPMWIERNIRRVKRIGLDKRERCRVLDLGCGCGYFLYICKLLGHEAIGLDMPDSPLYVETTALLGVPVVAHRIEPMQPLPDVGRVDVLTAHMVCFNGHCTDHVWGADEWRFLLDDVGAPVVSIEINREHDGTMFPPGLREYFDSLGAQIDEHRVLIDRR